MLNKFAVILAGIIILLIVLGGIVGELTNLWDGQQFVMGGTVILVMTTILVSIAYTFRNESNIDDSSLESTILENLKIRKFPWSGLN